jgi:hypothetical protein
MANVRRVCASRSDLLDSIEALAAREDEAQVAGAFGQRHEQLIWLRGDVHLVDTGNRTRLVQAVTRRRIPRFGMGIIITPLAASSRRYGAGFSPSAWRSRSSSREHGSPAANGVRSRFSRESPVRTRKSRSDPETQGARAEAADRTGGNFEHEHAIRVHPALGMDRSVPQTQRLRGRGDAGDDGALRLRGCRRGRQVNRLLEERTVQRIRLVEDRQYLQGTVVQQSLDGKFPSRE